MPRPPSGVSSPAGREFIGSGASVALCLLLVVSCSHVSREAERAFLRGDHAAAIDGFRQRQREAKAGYVVESSLLATSALEAGDYRSAERALEDAAAVMGTGSGPVPPAIKAMLRRRAAFLYRGARHEVALNALYRGLLALLNGDELAARRSLDQALAADANPDHVGYQSDIAALYLLQAIIALRLGDDAAAADHVANLKRLVPLHPYARLDYLAGVDTVLWIDTGNGPRRVVASGGQPAFEAEESLVSAVELRVDDAAMGSATLGIDVGEQATTTRGLPRVEGRPPRAESEQEVVGGLLSLINTSLRLLTIWAKPEQDVRHWHLVPGQCYVWVGAVGPGLHHLSLDFLDQHGAPLEEYRQHWHYLPFGAGRLNVYYFRDGPRKGFRRR